jgi:hypothetical protein
MAQFPYWCFGKTPYPTKAKALDRIRHQQRDRLRRKAKQWSKDQELGAYLCNTCGQWHVGASSRERLSRTDQRGKPIKATPIPEPKGYDRYGRPKGTEPTGETPVSSLHPDPQEQAGQVAQRQHQS